MYKLYRDIKNQDNVGIIRTSDNAYIPMDEQNTDYIEYLKWVNAGNTPIPADE